MIAVSAQLPVLTIVWHVTRIPLRYASAVNLAIASISTIMKAWLKSYMSVWLATRPYFPRVVVTDVMEALVLSARPAIMKLLMPSQGSPLAQHVT